MLTFLSKNRLLLHLCLLLFTLNFQTRAHTFQFNNDGEFTILHFSDLHYGDGNETKDGQTQQLQIDFLQKIKPDLVIITGDAIQGAVGATKPGDFDKLWKQFTKPMMDAKIPYAYVLGNHDGEGMLSRPQIVQLDQTNPWSVRSSCEGMMFTTNYILPIYSSRNPYELAANLWILDSGSVGCDGFISSWGCISQNQIDWYIQESDKIRERHGKDVHHIAFFHVPLPEVLDLYNNGEFYGVKRDAIGCPYINTGFFDVIKEKGDISGIFAGHDHLNSFGGWYKGVEFVYGIKSGYGTYGDYHGARVIKLKENYNEKGELNVTRSHYALFDNGTIVNPVNPKPRQGPKVPACHYPGSYSQIHVTFNKWRYHFKKWLFG